MILDSRNWLKDVERQWFGQFVRSPDPAVTSSVLAPSSRALVPSSVLVTTSKALVTRSDALVWSEQWPACSQDTYDPMPMADDVGDWQR